MPLLTDRLRSELRESFAGRLAGPVEVRLVLPAEGSGAACRSCDTARTLIEEVVAAAPEKITLTVLSPGDAGAEDITETPTLVVATPGGPGRIRYQGLPAGYEFATVVDAIERVSAGDAAIRPSNAADVEALGHDVEIMVFVTPTCPYCPAAATLAQRLALATSNVTALTVEATEFPALSQQFNVSGVPQIVVNRSGAFVGALPEDRYVAEVVRLAAAA